MLQACMIHTRSNTFEGIHILEITEILLQNTGDPSLVPLTKHATCRLRPI
jgi:hypothetical protein